MGHQGDSGLIHVVLGDFAWPFIGRLGVLRHPMGSSRHWRELSKINVKAARRYYLAAVAAPYGNLKFGRNVIDMPHVKCPCWCSWGKAWGRVKGMSVIPQ